MAAEQQVQQAVGEAAHTVEAAANAVTEASWLQTRVVLRVISVALAVAAVMWLLYSLEGVILLVVLSTFFAYLIAPLVEFVRRPFKVRGGEYAMPRPLAIGIVYLLLFGSLGLTVYSLAPRVADQLAQFTERRSIYREALQGRTQSLRVLAQRFGMPEAAQDAVVNFAPNALESAQEYGKEVAPEALSYLPWLVLIPILGFFLLKDAEGFRRSALQMLPRGRLRWRGDEFFQDVNSTLAAYIRATLIACAFIGVVCTAGFFLLGVNYWLPLGILAGLLEFIPLAGPLTVMVVAVVVASFDSSGLALKVFIFLATLRVVHDYVIYPRIVGQGIHLHPLAVVLAILCGEELAGLAGIFLAIPAVAIISVTYRHWLEHRGSEGIVADFLKPVEPSVAAATNDATTAAVTPGAQTTTNAAPAQAPTPPAVNANVAPANAPVQ